MKANLYALAAIALWASLAALGLSLRQLPPFLLTGIALMIGSTLAWPSVWKDPAQWKISPGTLGLGVFTLFGFHFLLFIALRLAPAVEVNLVNYLWPLFIVVLAPLYLPGVALRRVHGLAALMGFVGAALAILGGRETAVTSPTGSPWGAAGLGYLLALGSALIWANYSLQTKRAELMGQGFPTAAIGLFGLVSGLLSLMCHWVLEPSVHLGSHEWLLLALMGLGPLGAAFFLWDKALKQGDMRHIGILSYLTPLGSTVLLMLVTSRALSWSIALAAFMIIGAALLGTRRN
ncbi:DMT family transporter [Rhodoferax ferrireducens]|uniref:DMT family transporter n=1 Tax=Rhodoferax ferrireducens TaxID=192843 RepID=UPI000E0CF4B9|nr:EamA family transporter [Rhodoferax ferrireducens]